jgi:hypothetical protein
MYRSSLRLILPLAFTVTASCTTFTARQVDLTQDLAKVPHGILVPEEIPLLVIANGQASIVMVRSPNRATAISFGAFLAKHDVELDFEATGHLSKVVSNQDATAIPTALIDLAKTVADKLPTGLGLSASSGQSNAMQIYSIIFKDGAIDSLKPLLDDTTAKFVSVPYTPAGAGNGDSIEDVNKKGQQAQQTPPAPAQEAPAAPPQSKQIKSTKPK